ncbi:TonB-dependent receptor [Kaistella palustris]|uniref:TonB-dependent receptor n=1 Tax=Kaistella palustris TaxID=493376 RepID=UPI00040B663F|nr:carboxypeptidase regulatory-like domain-containing protein [Kaistella palustris]
MKKQLLFFFAFFCVMMSYAQSVISGRITDSDGHPVASASVTIEEQGKDAIMAFSISNSKGEFKVTFTSPEANVDLKIKAFNQKPLTRTVKNQTQTLNFSLEPDATEIKEVKLKTKLITKKGDTISYDLKAFESKADRTLADVLKKIPGIDVNPDGTVLYQGEPINKFYVNGKDLMEGGYGTINNSLPKDAVQKVEVMENHQPVKILQDKVPSENAALNVKLKKGITTTGRGEIGLGLDPLLWNVKVTPMFFSPKTQWVVNYKANNNGESVEKEGNLLSFGSRWEGRRAQAAPNRWLSVDNAATPDLPEKRYLMNNVHFFSANVLVNPFKNKEWELKASSSYTNNAISRESTRETTYELDTDFFTAGKVTTTESNKFYSNAAKGEIIFTKNAKKGFFKNTTTWNGFWNDDRGNSATQYNLAVPDPNLKNILLDESLTSPTGIFQNSLSTIIPWKEKLVNVMSYFSYQKDRQTLSATNQNFFDLDAQIDSLSQTTKHFDRLDQQISLKTLTANHSALVGFSYKKWTMTPEIGLNLTLNDMNSQLYGDRVLLNQSFQNHLEWNELNPYTQVGFNYKGSALNLNFTLPLNFYSIDYKDLIRQKDSEIAKTVFEPNLWGSFDFASFWKLWTFASLNYNFGDFGSVYDGRILTNPKSLNYRDSGLLPENRTLNSASRLEYRNPLNNLFFNIRYSYNSINKNLISRSQLFASGASSTSLEYVDNTNFSQSEGAEIGKYFPKFKTNASATFTNRDSNSFSILVDQNLVDNLIETKTNTQSFAFKFNNTYFSWMSLDYNISLNWYKNRDDYRNNVNKNSGWNHNLNVFFYPLENHTLGFVWDDISTSQGNTTLRNSFYDLSYQYTWSKKKIDFEVKWLNIANRKTYETISYNTTYFSTVRNNIEIRPSQVMFTVKFNFK